MIRFLARTRRLIFLWVILLVFGLVVPSPLAAQTGTPAGAPSGDISLQVQPFFSGHYKYGEWLPLRVTVTNAGAPVSAEVRVEMTQIGGQSAWLVPVELPTGAQKQITLYVFPTSFAQVARVRVLNGTQQLAVQNAPLTLHRATDYLVGVIASRPETLNALNVVTLGRGVTRSVRMLALTLEDVPARPEGLGALDALVLTDIDTSALSDGQKQALSGWVENGGRLIVGGGASAARTLAGLPDALAAEFRAQNNLIELDTLDALDAFGESPVRVAGPFAAAFAPGGQPLVKQTAGALVSEKRVGEGYVTYSALELGASPFDAWAGVSRFWNKILTPGSVFAPNAAQDISVDFARAREMVAVLENLPALALPSLNVLAALLVAYTALVGPLNYLVLRRLKKLDWGWLTIPVLTLLFAIGAFGISNQLRGNSVIVNQVSVVEFSQSGNARQVHTLVGLFSPTRGTFNLQFPENAFVIPVSNEYNPYGGDTSTVNVEIVESNPLLVRGVNLNQGALQGFAVESPPPPAWAVQTDLTVQGDHVTGRIVNQLGMPLSNAILVSGDHYSYLDGVPSQQPRSVDATWLYYGGSISKLPVGTTPTSQAQSQILHARFNPMRNSDTMPSSPYLLGWLDTNPVEVGVQNINVTHQGRTLVVVPVTLKYAQGTVQLTGNDWRVETTVSSGQPLDCGYANYFGLQAGNSNVILAFSPPRTLQVTGVKTLKVVLKEVTGLVLELQANDGTWTKIQENAAGEYLIESPQQFVTPNGQVRVRVSTTQQNQTCFKYGLEMEATVSE